MTFPPLAALFICLLCLADVRGLCESPVVAPGLLFNCQLEREAFFPESPPSRDVPVELSAAVSGFAGVPGWLRLLQEDDLSPGSLYGTPGRGDSGEVALKVTAMRLDTFASNTMELHITVEEQLQGSVLYEAELTITNYDIAEFLSPSVYTRFTAALSDAFDTDAPLILRVIDPSTRGVPVPAPPEKQGTIVVVTPGVNVGSVSMATTQQARSVQGGCNEEESFSRPPMDFGAFDREGFHIDWCQYTSYTVGNESNGHVMTVASGNTDRPRPPQGSSVSLVVVVVLVSVVMVMVVTGLAWVFLGGRKRAFYIPRERKERRVAMATLVYSSTKGVCAAGRDLRGLSHHPRRRSNSLSLEERPQSLSSAEEGLLEYHDVTDYSGDEVSSSPPPQSPPPAYTYPEDLLTAPLPQQPRRYRLITL